MSNRLLYEHFVVKLIKLQVLVERIVKNLLVYINTDAKIVLCKIPEVTYNHSELSKPGAFVED